MKYAIYKKISGEITMMVGTQDESFAEMQTDDLHSHASVNESITQDDYYIKPDTGKANLRGTTPCTPSTLAVPADGSTALTLSQMRDDTHITIAGPVDDVLTASGSVALTFSVPGAYIITATAPFPALSKTIEIEATDDA